MNDKSNYDTVLSKRATATSRFLVKLFRKKEIYIQQNCEETVNFKSHLRT